MEPSLDKFGRPLPHRQSGYYVPALTTDAVVFKKRPDNFHDILLITRKNNPYQGHLAFPGGFVDYNQNPLNGCLRELHQQCGLNGFNPTLITVSGDPQRDPRGHTVSIIYMVQVNNSQQVKAGDDAATAKFYPLEEIIANIDNLAFDHGQLLKEAIKHLGEKEKYGVTQNFIYDLYQIKAYK